MDVVMMSFKLIIYTVILFVFAFVLGNMYIDSRNISLGMKGKKETKVKKVRKKNWWGGLKSSKWWEKFRKKNEAVNRKILEGFVNVTQRTFDTNKFQQIILPDVENYDLEIAIPVDQQIYPTIQGNWGFNTDENGTGFSVGVYRDGYTADGCILKGISEKRYKFMLDRGPYVIRYELRKNNHSNQDIKVFVNNKEVINVQNEGVSSGKLKYIGTNETQHNTLTDSNAKGRRPLDYLKFIPKSNEINVN